jgi:hypothetical protein
LVDVSIFVAGITKLWNNLIKMQPQQQRFAPQTTPAGHMARYPPAGFAVSAIFAKYRNFVVSQCHTYWSSDLLRENRPIFALRSPVICVTAVKYNSVIIVTFRKNMLVMLLILAMAGTRSKNFISRLLNVIRPKVQPQSTSLR